MTGDTDRDNALFVNLVIIFQSAAMQQMGKIMNPITGKVDRNMEQARFSIDMLSMLKEKTRGNLSEDLERLLDSALLQLRMNYVEEAAAETAPAKDASADEESVKDAPRVGADTGGTGCDAATEPEAADKPAHGGRGARGKRPRARKDTDGAGRNGKAESR